MKNQDKVWIPSLDIWRIDPKIYQALMNDPLIEYDAASEGYFINTQSPLCTWLALKGFKLYHRPQKTMKEIW